MQRLLYFLVFIFVTKAATAQSDYTMVWENGRAVAVRFYFVGDEDELFVTHGLNSTKIFGQWLRDEYFVVFRPAIPFTVGESYQVRDTRRLHLTLTVESMDETAPEVVAIYPSGKTIPANQLKVYIRFNIPMRADGIYDYIFLADEAGLGVPGAILPLEPALWNHDNTLLTLWFDPGRIKRDLGPNLEKGTPLEPNQAYTLAVDGQLQSASGRILGNMFTKRFYTTDFDRTRPDPDRWTLKVPGAGTTEPLEVNFDEPLDYGALDGKLKVVMGKTTVGGSWKIQTGEAAALWTPDTAWEPGRYRLVIDPSVEDLAGNTLERLFDEDTRAKTKRRGRRQLSLDFVVK